MNDEAYLTMLESLTLPERKEFIQREVIASEERYLHQMVDWNQQDDELTRYAVRKAREALEDEDIQAAEDWACIARSTKAQRITIGEIRKQREKIQWEKNRLRQMTKPSTEPKQYSGHSKT